MACGPQKSSSPHESFCSLIIDGKSILTFSELFMRRKRQARNAAPPVTTILARSANRPRGQIILKMLISVDATGRKGRAYPDIALFADREGWLKIAKIAMQRAETAKGDRYVCTDFDGDPEDHDHMAMYIDHDRSDSIDFRLGTITPGNQRVVFRRFGISKSKAYKGSLVEWCDLLKKKARRLENSL